MNDIIVFIFNNSIFIFIAIFIILFVYSFVRQSKIKKIFQSLAMKYNGTPEGMFSNQSLMMTYHEVTIRLTTTKGSKYQHEYTRIYANVRNEHIPQMKLYPETMLRDLGKKFGLQDIQLGSQEFDQHYIIRGSDEVRVVSFLNYTVQDKLLLIRPLKPVIEISTGRMSISLSHQLKQEEDYDRLIEAAQVLIDRITDF